MKLLESVWKLVRKVSWVVKHLYLMFRECGRFVVVLRFSLLLILNGSFLQVLTDNVNLMAMNLTNQVRSIAQVTKAVAGGDLTKKIDVDVRGEILELKETVNGMTESLSVFADEVTRVAREVGTEGRLGGQATVMNVGGTWK